MYATTPGHPACGPPAARRGLSLIELTLALSLTAMAMAGLMGLVRMASQAAILAGDGLDGQQGARRAMERVTEELRWAETVVADAACAPSGLCPSRVRVRIPPGNPYRRAESYEVVFQYNPRQREIERRLGRGVNNLASRIDALEITYHDAEGALTLIPSAVARVRIAIVAKARTSRPVYMESTVSLRNRRIPYVAPPHTPAWRPSPRGYGEPAPPAPVLPPGPPGPGEAR